MANKHPEEERLLFRLIQHILAGISLLVTCTDNNDLRLLLLSSTWIGTASDMNDEIAKFLGEDEEG